MTKILDRAHPRLVLSTDLNGIAEVEKSCFNMPWRVSDFARCLDRKHCNGLVIEGGGQILAFLVYEARRRSIQLINIGVRPDMIRKGLGTKLIKRLIAFMMDSECSKLQAELRETNLNAQLFLQKLGFQATSVVRRYFKDTSEDMYNMEYTLANNRLVAE